MSLGIGITSFELVRIIISRTWYQFSLEIEAKTHNTDIKDFDVDIGLFAISMFVSICNSSSSVNLITSYCLLPRIERI